MKLSNRLSPFRIRRKLKNIKNAFYLNWLKKQFAHFGTGSFVSHILNLSGAEFISIGHHVRIGERCILEAIPTAGKQPIIQIGDNSDIGDYSHLGAIDYIKIGNNAYIGRFVLIHDHSHGSAEDRFSPTPPSKRALISKGGISIGDNVWIGDKVTILSGVTIGKGAIIGANSVVTHDVPDYCIAAGVPAIVLKDGNGDYHTEL